MLGFNPPAADPVFGPALPAYGPVRFEHQEAKVRRRGRKGLALKSRAARLGTKASRHRHYGRMDLAKELYERAGKASKRSRRGTSSETRRERRARNRAAFRSGSGSTRSTRRGRKASRRTNARDYVHYKAVRAATFGPVQFKDQPTWVRRKGRKGTAVSASRRSSKGRSRRSGESKKERRARNRAAFRAQRTRGKGSRRSQKGSRSARRSARKSGGGSALTYATLMRRLRGTKNKAWVCVGRKRTGCGGGKKGRRGSRVMGILRP